MVATLQLLIFLILISTFLRHSVIFYVDFRTSKKERKDGPVKYKNRFIDIILLIIIIIVIISLLSLLLLLLLIFLLLLLLLSLLSPA